MLFDGLAHKLILEYVFKLKKCHFSSLQERLNCHAEYPLKTNFSVEKFIECPIEYLRWMAELLRGLPFLWIKMHYAMMGFVQGYNVPVYKVMTLTAYAYSFFNPNVHLVWYNKFGMVHRICRGVTGYNFLIHFYFFLWRSCLPLTTV